MTRLLRSPIFYLAILPLWAVAASAQSSSVLVITPDKTTMLHGESRTFRLVDQDGQMQRNVTWALSDEAAFVKGGGDELTITAKSTGEFRLSAHSAAGSAEASVKVIEGSKLPEGTVKWSTKDFPGCKTSRIMPAVPSRGGADIFEHSRCEDGDYVAAYTADGTLLWRRKIGGAALPPELTTPAARAFSTPSSSFCDLVVVGTDQRRIRGLLNQQKLSFSEQANHRLWIVEQPNVQCQLWFDENALLSKKRKVFLSE